MKQPKREITPKCINRLTHAVPTKYPRGQLTISGIVMITSVIGTKEDGRVFFPWMTARWPFGLDRFRLVDFDRDSVKEVWSFGSHSPCFLGQVAPVTACWSVHARG